MRTSVWIYFLFGQIPFLHAASAATIQCPPVIKTHQSLQQKINEWDEFLDDWNNVYHFNRVTFYAGHPKKHASLAPDIDNPEIKNITWTFEENDIWLACGYSNTTVQLIKKLPDKTKKCTVTYNKDFSKVSAINCF